jgi:hypothetical protein
MVTAMSYEWRGQVTDAEVVRRVESYHGNAEAGWWDLIRPHSLGWVVGRVRDGSVVGFVNVAWMAQITRFSLTPRFVLTRSGRGSARSWSDWRPHTPNSLAASGYTSTTRSG